MTRIRLCGEVIRWIIIAYFMVFIVFFVSVAILYLITGEWWWRNP